MDIISAVLQEKEVVKEILVETSKKAPSNTVYQLKKHIYGLVDKFSKW